MKSIFILLLSGLFMVAMGADHYVRSGAAGNGSGSDWNNAYTNLPANLVRGDTYWLADGNYGAYTFDDNPQGDTYIYVMKGIPSNHGTDTGWNDSYGDGQAIFDRFRIQRPFYEINGQVGRHTSGYGIKIDIPDGTNDAKGITIMGDDSPDYTGHDIILKYIEIEEKGENSGEGQDDDSIYMLGRAAVNVYNITISHCYLHDTNRTHLFARSAHDITVEYTVFARRYNDTGTHGELLSIDNSGECNFIFRYNTVFDIKGTGILVFGLNHSSIHSNIYIYGNLFYRTDAKYYVTNGIITCSSGNTVNNCHVYNNTIAFLGTPFNSIGLLSVSQGSNNVAYNNIFYELQNPGNWRNTSHDYNWYYNAGSQSEANIEVGLGSPFVNAEAFDFNLSAPTSAGRTLSAPYNIDMYGSTRGEDGIWDRGAIEFSGEGPAVHQPQGLDVEATQNP